MTNATGSVKWFLLALSLAAGALVSGCRHGGAASYPGISGPGTIPGVSEQDDGPGASDPAPWVVEGVAKVGVLNFNVTGAGDGGDARAVADEIAKRVVGALAGANMRQNRNATDVLVHLAVEAELYNRRADFHIYKGNVDLTLTRVFDRMVLGRAQLEAEGKPGQGAAAGRRNVATALADQAADWVAETCTDAKLGLAVVDIAIESRFLARTTPDYVARFVRRVNKLDGVASCSLSSHTRRGGAVFRVVYFAEKFPHGIVNAIALIDELNFKEK